MGFKTPEDERQEFLAARPSWLQKLLQLNYSLSPDERSAWVQSKNWIEEYGKAREEYEDILRRIPTKWREYRRKIARNELSKRPRGRSGRPRKDTEAEEFKELHKHKSYAEIAIGHLKGTAALSPEATPEQQKIAIFREKERIRGLLRSRKRSSRSDKT